MPESPSNSSRALVASSLWLHIGLIGATALAAGLLQWFAGDPRLPWSPIVALFGGVLAVASWRRGFTVLEQAERESAVATDTLSESTLRVLQPVQTRGEGPVIPYPAVIARQPR
jgi:membrane protein implicated in regulation of membrane protease activity